jgi:hypothetical protein
MTMYSRSAAHSRGVHLDFGLLVLLGKTPAFLIASTSSSKVIP